MWGLEIVDCPDRLLARTAVRTVATALAGGETEVSVLLPDRMYGGLWRRILHDQTAEAIAREVSRLPHANVTMVPFYLESRGAARACRTIAAVAQIAEATVPAPVRRPIAGDSGALDGLVAVPIAGARCRRLVRLVGQVQSVRVQPRAGVPTLERVLFDESGGLSVVFLGRRCIAGVDVGTRMMVEGVVGEFHGRLAILNPVYQLLPP